MRRSRSVVNVRIGIASILTIGALAACSGNMTGATPPVQQAAPGAGMTAQGLSSTTNGILSKTPAPPAPAASADVPLTTSPTPLALPTSAGYGGTIVAVAASPVPSVDVVLGVTLQPGALNTALRDGASQKLAVHPLASLELKPDGGPALLSQGLAGMTFVLPPQSYATAKRFALGLFDLDLPPQPKALFHHKKTATSALIAVDDKTTISKTGQTISSTRVPITLLAAHRYKFVLFADRAEPTPSPLPLMAPSAVSISPLPATPSTGGTGAPSNGATPASLVSPTPVGSAPSLTPTPWLASTPLP